MAWEGKSSLDQLRENLRQRKKSVLIGVAVLISLIIIITLSTTLTRSTSIKTVSIGPSSEWNQESVGAPDKANSLQETKTGSEAVLRAEAMSVPGPLACTDSVACQSNSNGNKAEITSKSTKPLPTSTPTPRPTSKIASDAGHVKFAKGIFKGWAAEEFEWNNSDHWEYADKSKVPASMFAASGISLNSGNSKQPIRTKNGWGGEKIILLEWKRNELTDTNIWLLNTVIDQHFGSPHWPYRGELDIFEMFTQDKINIPNSSQEGFNGVADRDYGQFTLHMGKDKSKPCFCPASPSKSMWFANTKPMVTACGAQFPNSARNSMAIIFLNEKSGQSLQLVYNPNVKKSVSKNGQTIYDIDITTSLSTKKVENNENLFWGVPANNECVKTGGHNPTTGFPFFEDFRLVLEEQLRTAGAGFDLIDFRILRRPA
uniref:Uncharacterized protein AlNc14C171G8015 n=1 Tax=Albugo laibachii Nc14 TaxID=890382 RepID=F0WEK0_9STRA|nr:conserved hypothetical protein [Albugo laibachii Nc14]CCA22882.1 conserved hypothetical protein [Albugo laibachii Nc14]|eukprot:CCA22882.1 conserved hypothetical protein [Albugo laibachii Nc14]